jgi:hypothetical protein
MTDRPAARIIPICLALVLLASCGSAQSKDEPPANAAGFVPPGDVAATPMPGQTPETSATAYVGTDPNDPVGGVLFFDRTDVSKALLEAVPDNVTRAHFSESRGPEKPIYARGGKVVAAGCDAQDCSGRNWAFLFDPAAKTGEACYHDTATMQDSSRWFSNGVALMRGGMCPVA